MSNELHNQACYDRAIIFGLACYLIGICCLFLALMLYYRESPRAAFFRLFFVKRNRESIFIAIILLLGVGLALVAIELDAGICVVV